MNDAPFSAGRSRARIQNFHYIHVPGRRSPLRENSYRGRFRAGAARRGSRHMYINNLHACRVGAVLLQENSYRRRFRAGAARRGSRHMYINDLHACRVGAVPLQENSYRRRFRAGAARRVTYYSSNSITASSGMHITTLPLGIAQHSDLGISITIPQSASSSPLSPAALR